MPKPGAWRQVPELGRVAGEDSLAAALESMARAGHEEAAVFDRVRP